VPSGFSTRQDVAEVRGIGDIDSAVVVQTIAINQVGAGNPTLYTPPVNKVFLVFLAIVQNTGVGANTIKFQSGATDIARFAPVAGIGIELNCGGLPVLVGRAAGEALKLDVTADAVGYVAVGYRDA